MHPLVMCGCHQEAYHGEIMGVRADGRYSVVDYRCQGCGHKWKVAHLSLTTRQEAYRQAVLGGKFQGCEYDDSYSEYLRKACELLEIPPDSPKSPKRSAPK